MFRQESETTKGRRRRVEKEITRLEAMQVKISWAYAAIMIFCLALIPSVATLGAILHHEAGQVLFRNLKNAFIVVDVLIVLYFFPRFALNILARFTILAVIAMAVVDATRFYKFWLVNQEPTNPADKKLTWSVEKRIFQALCKRRQMLGYLNLKVN